MPLPGDLASASASLLFAQPPSLKYDEAAGVQDYLNELVDDGMHAKLLEAADMCSGMGGVYLRAVWDTDVADHAWIDLVPPDAAVPEFRYDRLVSVTFWTVLADEGKKVVRHLEKHIPHQNVILHGVYEGDQQKIGRPIDLGAFPETRPIAQVASNGVIELPDQPRDASTVVYIPNMRPNKVWRDLGPSAAPLGRSDFSGLESSFDALDEAYCADEATEILTDRGWAGYRDLRAGDTVLTLNHETGLSEWQPVQAVNVFPAQPREMLSIESRSHSSLTTLEHRWPVIRPHFRNGKGAVAAGTYKHVAGVDRTWATSGTLQWEDRIPIAADCADLPSEPKYSDALVEAVAWFWTEGHIRKLRDGRPWRNVTITQAKKSVANCERIRGALTKLLGAPTDFPRRGTSLTPDIPRWHEMNMAGSNMVVSLNAEAGDLVQRHAPGRVPSFEFLLSLTRAQLALFIETSMLADNNGKHALAQKDPAAAGAFQFACILAGYATSIRLAQGPKLAMYGYLMTHVRMRSQRVFYPLKGKPGHGKPQRVTYDGEVWCPTTPNGTWLARRNGTVYFTGNSSWMRDIRLGKARLIVPHSYLDNIGKGKGAVFEPEREVYAPLNMLVSGESAGANASIVQQQFDIRWQAHKGTVDSIIEYIITRAGYSGQSLGLIGDVATTATEVVARERKSLTTRAKKINYWRPALADIIYGLMTVNQIVYGATVPAVRPDIEFPDVVMPDALELAQTVATLRGAESISVETAVATAHPDWDTDQVAEEVSRIYSEMNLDALSRARVMIQGQPTESLSEQLESIPQALGATDVTRQVEQDTAATEGEGAGQQIE